MAGLAIIAGLGDLPVSIASACEADGRTVYVFRLAGFVEPKLARFPGETIGLGQIGKLIKRLKAVDCDEVVFAGIVKRPNFADVKLDLRGARLLPRVLKAARQGDDALLRVIIAELEGEGFSVVAAEQAASSLKIESGLIFGPEPTDTQMDDLRKAAATASAIGRLDIGQGCVVCNGLILAVEAQEGTDRMLERVAGLELELRGDATNRLGVLVKRPKPIQERRIDLPTIGPRTIERAAQAGLAGIGLEEEGALLLGRERIGALCEQYGLFLYGFPSSWS